MEYNQISGFLEKFKKILFQKEEVYKIVSEVVFQKTKILIKTSSVKIQNTTIYIDCSPVLKNEILIYKKEIISSLKEKTPNHFFVDIR